MQEKSPVSLASQEIKLCEINVGVSQFRRVLDTHEESVNANKHPQNLIYLYGSSYFLANSAIFSGGQPGTSIPSPNPIASN